MHFAPRYAPVLGTPQFSVRPSSRYAPVLGTPQFSVRPSSRYAPVLGTPQFSSAELILLVLAPGF